MHLMIRKMLFLLCVITFLSGCKNQESDSKTLLFVGSFTDKKPGKGIHIYEFDERTAETTLRFTLDNITNTSFQKLSTDGKFLYSVVDSQMKYNGKIAAFKVDDSNVKLELLNMQDCGGLNPAHIAIDKTGKYLANSNYSDGSLSLFQIKDDGSLSAAKQVLHFKDSSIVKNRQEASHIHSSNFSTDNKYLFAHDLGADKIRKFIFNNSESRLEPSSEIKAKSGSGPRHFTFHPNGNFGYGINELSGTIDAYQYKNGNLIWTEDYQTYQQKQNIYRAADIHISDDGNFLYASIREPKENSIVVYAINKENGKLQLIEHKDTGGVHPRNFVISPSGKYVLVANQFSNNISIYKRDSKTGKLTKLQKQIAVNSPSSLQIFNYQL